jgi:hypothetical protein
MSSFDGKRVRVRALTTGYDAAYARFLTAQKADDHVLGRSNRNS